MEPTALYAVCVIGALGLFLLVRPGGPNPLRARPIAAIGGLLGIGAFGWFIATAATALGDEDATKPGIFFLTLSFVAVAAATKMITTARPVYSALYFVLVVIASAGLFLLLEAEFMAFALVIVYAGAILITYMFVLMLAQQSPDPDDPSGVPEYDLRAREPLAGAAVGFVLLALLTRMAFDGAAERDPRVDAPEARMEAWAHLESLPGRMREMVAEQVDGEFEIVADDDGRTLRVTDDGAELDIRLGGTEGPIETVMLGDEAIPENVQVVGLGLVERFPVSLELAGVILLMAMFGAVILARRQIELSEDEKREAAGLRRFGHHDDPGDTGGGGS